MFGISSNFNQDGLLDIVDALPHGSGIDCDWNGYVTKHYVSFTNAFHCMDENGMYDGYADFTVKLPLVDGCLLWDEFTIEFNGRQSGYLATKYDLREYLLDTIYYELSEYF